MNTLLAAAALVCGVAAQSSNPLPPGTPGMCFKQKRFHSIPALNLQIPLNVYQNGQNVDASLRYAMSKLSLPPQSGNLMKDCLDTHNVFRILSGVTPLTWSFSAQAVAQNWANKLASSGAFEHSHTPGYGENLYRESGMSNSCQLAIKSWYEEFPIYASNSPIGSGNFEGYGHYTQLIDSRSRQVGCAQATGASGVTTVCEYVPPGNVAGTGIQKKIA